jgi:hypothetical protein
MFPRIRQPVVVGVWVHGKDEVLSYPTSHSSIIKRVLIIKKTYKILVEKGLLQF